MRQALQGLMYSCHGLEIMVLMLELMIAGVSRIGKEEIEFIKTLLAHVHIEEKISPCFDSINDPSPPKAFVLLDGRQVQALGPGQHFLVALYG